MTAEEVANVSQFDETDNSWAVNDDDDPVKLLDPAGNPIDIAFPDKDSINHRQIDGTWNEDNDTIGAAGATTSLPGYSSPIYIYEIGEKGSSTRLNDYQGNYVMLYVAGYLPTAIFDWRVDGSSIASLNMPFESAVSATTSDAILDYSSDANHGTLGGGTASAVPTWHRDGIRGGAYDFDGVDDYIAAPYMDFITKTGNYTFSAWVYYEGPGAGQSETIFQNAKPDDRNGMNIVSNQVRFGYYDGTSWSGVSGNLGTNTWTHVVGLNAGGTLALYINGVAQTGSATPYVSSDASQLLIGKASISSAPHNWEPFNGKIDEVLIYNKIISADQISELYNSGASGNQVLSAAETNKAEVYQVVSTPNDNVEDGVSQISNAVTIENSLPTCAAQTKVVNEDTAVTFSAEDFMMTDTDGDVLSHIRVIAINGGGILDNNGAALVVNDEVTKANIDLDYFTFLPAADESGDGYASFDFEVNDGDGYSVAACAMTINVTPVNDPPEITVAIFRLMKIPLRGLARLL